MDIVKLSLCVLLCGGSPKEVTGSRKRSRSHILLVGDAGVSKSNVLTYVSSLIPRSVLVSVACSTGVGLLASCVKENKEFVIESGALNLADNSVGCIDEFSALPKDVLLSLHEPLEQMTISVAKAGIVTSLDCRTSVICARNPKMYKYDDTKTFDENLGIPGSLISRFDLIFLLRDTPDETFDRRLYRFILGKTDHDENCHVSTIWEKERIKKYFLLLKGTTPKMTSDAYGILSAYYAAQRKNEARNNSRTTNRLLDSQTSFNSSVNLSKTLQ